MKGANDLVFNEATVVAALQEYLDKRYTVETPSVMGVTSYSNGGDFLFKVKVCEKAPKL